MVVLPAPRAREPCADVVLLHVVLDFCKVCWLILHPLQQYLTALLPRLPAVLLLQTHLQTLHQHGVLPPANQQQDLGQQQQRGVRVAALTAWQQQHLQQHQLAAALGAPHLLLLAAVACRTSSSSWRRLVHPAVVTWQQQQHRMACRQQASAAAAVAATGLPMSPTPQAQA